MEGCEEAGGDDDEDQPLTRRDLDEALSQHAIKVVHNFGQCHSTPWDNRGGVCGVCNATWSVGDTWSRGNGKWACFSCQVYICSFECLNEHNMNNVGNTVEPGKKIYEHRHEMEEDGPPRQRK